MNKLLRNSFITLGVVATTYVFFKSEYPCKLFKYNCQPEVTLSEKVPIDVVDTYEKGHFVVTFPPNSDTAAIVKSLLERGWLRISICPCSPYLQYWIDPTPDGSNTGTASGGSTPGVIPTDVNITPNYNISVSDINNNVGGTINTNSNNTGQPVKIATIDSGVDFNNSSLSNSLFRNGTRNLVVCNSLIQDGIYGLNMLYRIGESPEPMDADGHGTFINGILSNNYRAPNHTNFENSGVSLQLLNVKFYNNRASGGKLYDALCGIYYALNNGASVINASWKVRPQDADIPIVSNAFYYTLSSLKSRNAMLVASAGNDPNPTITILPASLNNRWNRFFYNNIITVGSSNNNSRSTFSGRGDWVDIYAPGERITSIYPNNQVMDGWGTSYATPIISRAVGILRGLNPDAAPDFIKKTLLKNHSDRENNDGILMLRFNSNLTQ